MIKMSNHTIQLGGTVLNARKSDNYINVTQLCQAAGKEFKHWNANKTTSEFIVAFANDMYCNLFDEENKDFLLKLNSSLTSEEHTEQNIKEKILELSIVIGSGGKQTWVHPLIAINIAQWCSPKFSFQVSVWINRLLRDGIVKAKDAEIQALKDDFANKIRELSETIEERDKPGYIYCIWNSIMPDVRKIGFTTRDPLVRLGEANKHHTWKLPSPFVMEFARRVENCSEEESRIHLILAEKRIKGEFFREEKDTVMKLFEQSEGIWWNP